MSAPRPVARTGWLLECADGDAAAGMLAAVPAALAAAGLPAPTAVRRGARTVLVDLATPAVARAAGPVLEAVAATAEARPAGRAHTLDVVYDGADLADVAEELAVSPEALVHEHASTTWRAEFCGFAPGFAYLSGWTRSVARLATPRTRVPAGAVGLAAAWSAAYPSDSPGGWRLLGRTGARLWDTAREAPALLLPGDTVRWRPVREVVVAAPPGAEAGPTPGGSPTRGGPGSPPVSLRVIDPGTLTLVEDLGRGGLEHLGVPPSGAADRASARRANRIVGNPADAAVLENVGGLRLEALGDLVVAVVGPRCGLALEIEGAQARTPAPGAAFVLRDGEEVVVSSAPGRCGYLAVRGGIATPVVLGSRSADALGRLAWWPVAAGTELPVGAPAGVVGIPEPDEAGDDAPVRVVLGPRDDLVADAGALLATTWTVGPDTNRVGVRLRGTPLSWAATDELASEPMVPGAIQVPASGLPVVLLRDHPTTGGYPVVAVVVAEDLDRVARLAPGESVRFAAVAG